MKSDTFQNKTILITGGTGSFGTKMVKHLLSNSAISQIRVFSRDEEKQDRMRNEFNNSKLKFIIGDIRNYKSVINSLSGVDYVFHAAALKQVPSCEFYPMEAVLTNVIGAENLLSAAAESLVKKVVVLSTDKAVYPINAMGMTKAIMEKLMVAKARSSKSISTTFCATRYGNVMASRGSVIPLFVDQAMRNADLTITDPNMTRFLMSLDESVELVLYSFSNGNNGDIFVQKAPAAKIIDLATAIIKIFSSKSKIKIIGYRHGEKQHETLVNREEMIKAVDCGKFYRIPSDFRTLNYHENNQAEVIQKSSFEYTSSNTKQLNVDEIIDKLLKLDYINEKLNS